MFKIFVDDKYRQKLIFTEFFGSELIRGMVNFYFILTVCFYFSDGTWNNDRRKNLYSFDRLTFLKISLFNVSRFLIIANERLDNCFKLISEHKTNWSEALDGFFWSNFPNISGDQIRRISYGIIRRMLWGLWIRSKIIAFPDSLKN